jgi:hypothetical protein
MRLVHPHGHRDWYFARLNEARNGSGDELYRHISIIPIISN